MTALTPAEAAEKLCPTMLPFAGAGGELTEDCGCRGPACMAWRWLPADPDADALRRRGWCGLAGMPADAATPSLPARRA